MTEKDLRDILSKNIRRLRSYRKLSQADFAEKVDISIPFLSDIENRKKWVSPTTLVKMAEALHIETYELLKPETVIPDNVVTILEKYIADIYQLFGDTLNSLQHNYIEQIKNNGGFGESGAPEVPRRNLGNPSLWFRGFLWLRGFSQFRGLTVLLGADPGIY